MAQKLPNMRRTVEVPGGSAKGRTIFSWRASDRGRVWVVAAQIAIEGGRHGLAQHGGFGGRTRIAPLLAYMKKHQRGFYQKLLSHFGTSQRLETALYNRGHKAFYENAEPRGTARFQRSREHYRNDLRLAPHVAEAERIVVAALRSRER